MQKYGIVLQGTLGEFTRYPEKFNLLGRLMHHPSVKGIIIAAPSLDLDENARQKIEGSGASVYIGDDYNVAKRILTAHKSAGWEEQQMVARICSSWNHIDMDLIDIMMADAFNQPCSYLYVPKDFDYTAAADIASQEALHLIATLMGDTAEASRARFNPWSYLEAYSEKFDTRMFMNVPTYTSENVGNRLANVKLIYDENEFFGRNYAGSRYDGLIEEISQSDIILDMATGSGHGAARLSQKASLVVGVDYLPEYIQKARDNYPEHERLHFQIGDARNYMYLNGNSFSVAISLHTIEHVAEERALLQTLHKNLKPGGKLILEVPIMMKRPWGRPTNHYHLREYSVERIEALVIEGGFRIKKAVCGCRGIYSEDLQKMRGEYRLYAEKK